MKDGGPAFPIPEQRGQQYDPVRCEWEQGWVPPQPGMSLRAWLAGMAMIGGMPALRNGSVSPENFVKDNCHIADLMIAALDKDQTNSETAILRANCQDWERLVDDIIDNCSVSESHIKRASMLRRKGQ